MSATADAYLFKEIMNERREHALKRLTNPHLGPYIPSPRLYENYRRIRTLPVPVSNDDELDDAVAQIKSVGNTGATTTSNDTKSGVTDATNTYQQTQQESDFKAKMEESRKKALSDSATSINATYDKAEELGANLPPSQQNAIFAVMDTLENGFHMIWGKIADFISNAVSAVVKFIQEAWDKIKDFFGGIASDIASIF